MFRPFDNSIILNINEHTYLKFIEVDAPFCSNLKLYHDNKTVSDCSFKPDEIEQIKENFKDFASLMAVLKDFNNRLKNVYLGDFINRIECYKNDLSPDLIKTAAKNP